MPKVYIVQETNYNVYPAREYGELQVMLMHRDVVSEDHIIETLKRELKHVKSEDYILCIGDPLAIGLAIHIALTNTKGKINVLTWDKKTVSYEESTILM